MNIPLLTEKESTLYSLLLQHGELPVHSIISLSRLKRPTAYKALYELEKKGLAQHRTHHKKIHFRPASPTELSQLMKQKYDQAHAEQLELQSLLPQLTQLFLTSVEKPVVSTFQGVDGLKHIYEDTLKVGQPIYAALTTDDVEPELFKWITRTYTKKRIQANIPVHVLVASGGWAEEYVKRDTKELRETRLVPKSTFPFQHEIDIYGDKVAFINFRKGGSLVGIVIHHPQIARSMQALWSLAWQGAKVVNP